MSAVLLSFFFLGRTGFAKPGKFGRIGVEDGFNMVYLGFTGFYWVLPGCTMFLPGFTGFY